MLPSLSIAVMFLPTSPRPPSGVMRVQAELTGAVYFSPEALPSQGSSSSPAGS
jgi:CBS-domain-containing membrane protein